MIVEGDRVLLTTAFPDGSRDTVAYSDIEASPGGVTNFKVNDAPLSERIASSSEVPVGQGVEVEQVISYLERKRPT